MLLKLLLLSVVLIFIVVIFFGLRILLKKNGRFPETHVGRNKEMQKHGITCAQDTDLGCTPSDVTGECMTCGRRFGNEG